MYTNRKITRFLQQMVSIWSLAVALLLTIKAGLVWPMLYFSSKHTTSNITKYWTGARWDHIGVVVKPSPNKAYIIEWGNGLFACELVDRLNEYAELE